MTDPDFLGLPCTWRRGKCDNTGRIICLSICPEEHISEQWMCIMHALRWWETESTCWCGNQIVDKLPGEADGHEPYEPKFYKGEWVAVRQSKVLTHSKDPTVVIEQMKREGKQANVYKA